MMPSFSEIIKEACLTMRADIRQTTITLWVGCCIFAVLSVCGWKLLEYPRPLPSPKLQHADKFEVIRLSPAAMAEQTARINADMERRARR